MAIVGTTTLSCIAEIISTFSELIKSIMGVGISICNRKIKSETETKRPSIGFTTTIEGEEEYDD